MHKFLRRSVLFLAGLIFISLVSGNAAQSLLERLVSPEGVTRTVARKDLKNLSNAEKQKLVDPLREIVRRNHRQESIDAVIALGKIGPMAKEAVPDIVTFLKGQSSESQLIFNTLVEIGTASIRGIIPLLECRETGDDIPTLANEALARIGGPVAQAAMKQDTDCGSPD